ncbi:MAG: cation transporter [Erysipelotrichales bacterium]|nr:cation transporter [Erysipelotrichales bacterium]
MDRYKEARKASILGIIGNIFLLIIKGIIGFITNSQAMLSDTLNSAGDVISSLMTYIGNKISSKEPDSDHNLGHGKAEYIFSMMISEIMLLFSTYVFISSIKSLFVDYSYQFSIYLFVICTITIIIKLALYLYTIYVAKKYNNILVKANAQDHINDCVLTSLNLIAALCGMVGITFVDGVVGSLVAIWIFIFALKLFKESFDVLMDKGMNEKLKNKILRVIKKHPEIKNINHFNSTPVGFRYQVSLTIFVDGNLSTFESHEIANKLEKEISAIDEIYLTIIHVNPE